MTQFISQITIIALAGRWLLYFAFIVSVLLTLTHSQVVNAQDCFLDTYNEWSFDLYGTGRAECSFRGNAGEVIQLYCENCITQISVEDPYGATVRSDSNGLFSLPDDGIYTFYFEYQFETTVDMPGEEYCVGVQVDATGTEQCVEYETSYNTAIMEVDGTVLVYFDLISRPLQPTFTPLPVLAPTVSRNSSTSSISSSNNERSGSPLLPVSIFAVVGGVGAITFVYFRRRKLSKVLAVASSDSEAQTPVENSGLSKLHGEYGISVTSEASVPTKIVFLLQKCINVYRIVENKSRRIKSHHLSRAMALLLILSLFLPSVLVSCSPSAENPGETPVSTFDLATTGFQSLLLLWLLPVTAITTIAASFIAKSRSKWVYWIFSSACLLAVLVNLLIFRANVRGFLYGIVLTLISVVGIFLAGLIARREESLTTTETGH